jgi:hypothetical protein
MLGDWSFQALLMPHREARLMESEGPSIRLVGLILDVGRRDRGTAGIARLAHPLADPHLHGRLVGEDAGGDLLANNR